jgi:hypothetical protein
MLQTNSNAILEKCECVKQGILKLYPPRAFVSEIEAMSANQ